MSSWKLNKSQQTIQIAWETSSSQEVFSLVDGVQNSVSSIQERVEIISNNVIRIYLVRHYPSKDKSNTVYYNKLDEIPNDEKEKLKKTYAGIFSHPEKTLFIYDDQDWMERVRFTAIDLLGIYGAHIPEDHIVRDISLRGTYDDNEDPLLRKERTTGEIIELRSIIKERNLKNIDTIVIIGNRTYCEPFDLLSGGKKDILQKDLEATWYLFRDFGTDLEPILPTNDALIIRPEDQPIFQLLFPEIEDRTSQGAQSVLVNKFIKEPHLFGMYLTHPDSPASLRTFCLANLIKNKEYKTIEDYYLRDCQQFSHDEKSLLLEHVSDSEIKTLVRKLFLTKPNFWKEEEGGLFSKVWKDGEDFYTLLKKSKIAYKNAQELQSKSLDPLIRDGKSGAIMKREIYTEGRTKVVCIWKNNSDNDSWRELVTHDPFYPQILLEKSGKYSHFILHAHVGEGKSIYLSDLVKQISLECEHEVIFIAAKDIKNPKELFVDPEVLVCIDALDEARDNVLKESIKTEIRAFPGTCIVSARYSESFEGDGKIRILKFQPLDSDVYIDSRFPENPKKQVELKNFLKKHWFTNYQRYDVIEDFDKWIKAPREYSYGWFYEALEEKAHNNEIKGNPLLLNLIVLLAKTSEEEKDWNNNIRNRSDLYERVVRFILADHSKKSKGQACTRRDLDRWMNELWQYAYTIFLSPESLKIDADVAHDFDTHLSILFRYTQDNSYDFVHKSFYEFFLARYLANIPQGYDSILKLHDNFIASKNTEYRNTLFYYTDLVVDKEIRIADFIELFTQLEKRDKTWTSWYFFRLELLSKIYSKHNIPEIDGLVKKSLKWISLWDIQEMGLKEMEIKEFSLNVSDDNIFLNWIIKKISESKTNLERLSSVLISIWTDISIEKAIELIHAIIDNKNYRDGGNLFLKLLDLHPSNPLVIKAIPNIVLIFINNQDYSRVIKIYEIFTANKSEFAGLEAVKCGYLLFQKKQDYEACEIIKMALQSEKWMVIDEVVKIWYNIVKNWSSKSDKILNTIINMHIETIMKLATPSIIGKLGKVWLLSLKNGDFMCADYIFTNLVNLDTPFTLHKATLTWKILMEEAKVGSYSLSKVREVFLDLVKEDDWI